MPTGHYNRCSQLGCNRKAVARGMCRKHYAKWRRDGYMEDGVVVTQPEGSTVKEYLLAPNRFVCKLCGGDNYADLRSPLPTFKEPDDLPMCISHFREEVSHAEWFIGKEAARQAALVKDLARYTDDQIRAMT